MPQASQYVAPRWVGLLQDSLNKSMAKDPGQIAYALSSSSDNGPRVRMVVHRGFLNERRSTEDPSWSENPSKDSEGHPFTSSTMLVTTDVRGPKAAQILSSSVVEFVWWHSTTQHQFRIRAKASILPPAGHPFMSMFPASELTPPGLTTFNWESERLRQFRKLNPPLRASFVRPIPGTPLEGTDIDPSTFPKGLPSDLDPAATPKEKEQIAEALKNFSLIVLNPFDIDMCDLSTDPHERIQWNLSDGGKWVETAVVA
ncbi:pyridoxamine 5'-phosphate oxidase, partial [Phenoliferia sp. Uapishka_3]